jgi:hypothetical protein
MVPSLAMLSMQENQSEKIWHEEGQGERDHVHTPGINLTQMLLLCLSFSYLAFCVETSIYSSLIKTALQPTGVGAIKVSHGP